MGLLTGTRVLESAQLFNGDTLGVLLADLGADVIKIESPFRGDYLRDFLGQVTPHYSPAHLQVNKNKRSIALDLRQAQGLEVFWELLDTADVFVDGNSADAMAKLGVGYEDQRLRRPEIVYCQYTGYGATGPYATIPTHGQMMNAAAGGTPLEMDGNGLVRPYQGAQTFNGIASGGEGTAAGATFAALHVAAALVQRQRTGEGCHIDVSASEAVISSAWIAATYQLNDDRIADRRSLPDPIDPHGTTSAKYQFYRTSDKRYVLFCCIEQHFWKNFCKLAGREDLIGESDAGPVDFAVTADPDQTLRREVQKIIETRTQAEWTGWLPSTIWRSDPHCRPTSCARIPSSVPAGFSSTPNIPAPDGSHTSHCPHSSTDAAPPKSAIMHRLSVSRPRRFSPRSASRQSGSRGCVMQVRSAVSSQSLWAGPQGGPARETSGF